MGFLNDIISGVFGNESTDKAADSMVDATKQSNETLMRMFNTSNQINEPNRIAGLNALSMQGSLLGNPNMVDPGSVNRSIQATSGQGTSGTQYTDYVGNNPGLAGAFQGLRPQDMTYIKNKGFDANGDGQIDQGEYGQFHYSTMGQNEGRQLPTQGGQAGGQSTGQVGQTGSPVQTGISTDDAYGMFNDSGFARSMLETTDSDMQRMVGQYGAAGNALSGSALKGLNDVNRRNTSTAFGNYYNALSGISGTGAQIGQQAGQNAMTTGNNIAGNQKNIGNIRGSSYLQQGQNNANMANSGVNNASDIAGWFGLGD